jgi:radical SAM superfamily enzyme YgiQ (UPF0313 family)
MSQQLDILFINPSPLMEERIKHFKEMNIKDNHSLLPNIGIAYLLAVAKKNGISAKYLDVSAKPICIEEIVETAVQCKPRVVGFTGWTSLIKKSAEIAKLIKEKLPETLICIGGPHGTAIPEETLQEFKSFDFVMCGEAENTLVELFTTNLAFDKIPNIVSRTKSIYCLPKQIDLDLLPFPAWEEFDLNMYNGFNSGLGTGVGKTLELPVSTSRGCFGTCTFCWRQFGRVRRHRSVDSVLNEIERNVADFKCHSINFFDETFVDNNEFEWSIALCEGMIKRQLHKKIRWAGEMRVDIKDPGIFKLMKNAGCYFMFFGVESGTEKIRRNVGKIFTNEQISNTISAARDSEINCAAAFILGLPGETEETMMTSIKFAQSLNIYSTTFPIAVPFPGTAIRRSAEKGQWGLKILSKDWDVYDKQYPGVMDSQTLSIDTIRKYQALAYEMNPQRKMKL